MNTEEFRKIFEEISPNALRLAFSIFGNHDDARDAVQEAFMKVYEARESFRGDSDVSTWAFRVVLNTCLTHHRPPPRWKGTRVPLESADEILDHSLELWELPRAKSERHYIRNMIDTLPEREAKALRLYYYREYSYAQIARAMHTSVPAVAALLTRAKERLEVKITKFRTDMRKEIVE